jgi:RNA polymerase sigma-70 factor, ECF subfamily
MTPFDPSLLPPRAALLAYLRRRVESEAAAEDLLQDALLRALRAAPDLRSTDRLVPWFYRILDHAVTDHYRRRGVRRAAAPRLAAETDTASEPDDEAVLCECFRALLPALTPAYADLIAAMDLGGASDADVAARLGVTRGALKVRHHRARRQLRERLDATCRTCARHGCLDCTCRPAATADPV